MEIAEIVTANLNIYEQKDKMKTHRDIVSLDL